MLIPTKIESSAKEKLNATTQVLRKTSYLDGHSSLPRSFDTLKIGTSQSMLQVLCLVCQLNLLVKLFECLPSSLKNKETVTIQAKRLCLITFLKLSSTVPLMMYTATWKSKGLQEARALTWATPTPQEASLIQDYLVESKALEISALRTSTPGTSHWCNHRCQPACTLVSSLRLPKVKGRQDRLTNQVSITALKRGK